MQVEQPLPKPSEPRPKRRRGNQSMVSEHRLESQLQQPPASARQSMLCLFQELAYVQAEGTPVTVASSFR